MTTSTETNATQSTGRSTYDTVILYGVPPLLLVLIVYFGWLIASSFLPVSDVAIAEAGKESICVKEGLQSSLTKDVPVTFKELRSIRNECSELMQEQAESDAKKLAAQMQRKALEAAK